MIGSLFKHLAPTAGAIRYKWKHDGLIHCMEARRGRGKSYNLTDLVHWCATNRVQVRSNVRSIDYVRLAFQLCMDGSFNSVRGAAEWLQNNVIYLDTWDDLLTSYDCIVIIDEATRLFEGRKGMQAQPTPPVIYEWLQQCRKFRVTVWLATQSFEWLDKKVAQLVDVLWLCRKRTSPKLKAPDGTPLPTHFYMYGLDPGGAGNTESVVRKRADFVSQRLFRREIATLYDSWERIKLIGGTPTYPTVSAIDAYLIDSGNVLEIDTSGKLVSFLNNFDVQRVQTEGRPQPARAPQFGRASRVSSHVPSTN